MIGSYLEDGYSEDESKIDHGGKRSRHLERRARAHEKLLLHAYSALTISPPPKLCEKGEDSERRQSEKQNNIHHSPFPQSDGRNEDHLFRDKKDATLSKESIIPSIKKKSPALQRQTLEKFCLILKNNGIDVLKLNREKKWQHRILTVSKEGTWLKNSNFHPGDRVFCPLGILWVKKFNHKTKEHSITSIDKQKKGGDLSSLLIHARVESQINSQINNLPKKLGSKFQNTIQVKLVFTQNKTKKSVYFRCSSKEDAKVLVDGCNAIIYSLKGSKPKSKTKSSDKSTSGDKSLQPSNKNQLGSNSDDDESDMGLWEV